MASSFKERRKSEETNSPFHHNNRNIRRGKPQQQLYRPGSGPLRKSGQCAEETASDMNSSTKPNESLPHFDQSTCNRSDRPASPRKFNPEQMQSKPDTFESRKKSKKPEQAIYVPKPVAQAMAEREITVNGHQEFSQNHHRSKRYSTNRRRTAEINEPTVTADRTEPRHSNGNRVRDTRSMEPQTHPGRGRGPDKLPNKPPSGRRHSTICLEGVKPLKPMPNLEQMAPRFRKKYLAESGFAPNSFIQTCSEGSWDGNSVTFQGHSSMNYSRQNYMQMPGVRNDVQQMPAMGMQQNHSMPPNNWAYNTLPHARPRGRGRLRSEDCDLMPPPTNWFGQEHVQYSSRPTTPQLTHATNFVHPNVSTGNNFSCANNAVVKDDFPPKHEHSAVSEASSNDPSSSLLNAYNDILDWSEEVELNDALTRSSSVVSLVDTSVASMSNSQTLDKDRAKRHKNKRKGRRDNRRRSNSRGGESRNSDNQHNRNNNNQNNYRSNQQQNVDHRNANNSRSRQNSYNSTTDERIRMGGRSRIEKKFDNRDSSYDRSGCSRDCSFDRNRRDSHKDGENWREEIRSRKNSERNSESEDYRPKSHVPGLLVLPQQHSRTPSSDLPKGFENYQVEHPVYPVVSRKPITSPTGQQRTLFDPNNPQKPILVKTTTSREQQSHPVQYPDVPSQQNYITDQYGILRPMWYNQNTDNYQLSHYPELLDNIKRAEIELQCFLTPCAILRNWSQVDTFRQYLQKCLMFLLKNDLKFCEKENVEQHFWKILFYNIVEMLRKAIGNEGNDKEQYKSFLISLIDEGTKYYEVLLEMLEKVYRFKLNFYLGGNKGKATGFVNLALISAQKIFLFLGDLGRYRELINDTTNYGKCRQWYIKAQEINPKNGRPYNQLAVLAVYARRKLDAVYYYMRSLMSSNPVQSARESLISLFDENRKKYEQGERKRRDERLERARQHMLEKESSEPPSSLRREIWTHPVGGRRVHRTTSTASEQKVLSEEEDLTVLTAVEVNKRFVTSYLHVHGKLITKIGMESFNEAALQMLREFRALLQHSPVPLPRNRFLQLLALNMFAIETTQLKDPHLSAQAGLRSELQERALVISIQMFNLILERCVVLLQEFRLGEIKTSLQYIDLPADVQVMLPAIKIWCDWMLCHSSDWNPPPSTLDYRVGPPGDAWVRLAALMNLLDKLDHVLLSPFCDASVEGAELVRLPEDATLHGFTPLMSLSQEEAYVPNDSELESAQIAFRISKILFFGTTFLCGLEPPVLKLQKFESGYSEYISVVNTFSNRDSQPSYPEVGEDVDLLVESFSEDEEEDELERKISEAEATSEIKELIARKMELEKRQRTQDQHRQRVQNILRQSVVSVEMEIRPKYLVPDTNCFIDYVARLKALAEIHVYTLMVPLVVVNELEGLARGGKAPAPSPRVALNPEHILKVADSAKQALEFIRSRNTSVKCLTTRGTVLASTTFTVEDDSVQDVGQRNDDKILATCLSLCKAEKDQNVEGAPRRLVREVVLLTEDRNLRVKALARDVPVRELPDFLQWAGQG